jgi:pentatricopeptide repeat protein
LARAGKLRAALQLLEAALSAGRDDLVSRLSHRAFLRAAGGLRGAQLAVLRFLQLLPPGAADARTYNLALHACAARGDVDAAASVAAMMGARGVPLDVIHRTTLVGAATRALNMGAAFKYYADARQAAADAAAAAASGAGAAAGAARRDAARLDGWVYGALIAACAAGIKAAASDRKEQLVLLERAFGVLDDAAAAKVHLEAPAWNALLMCCGESPGAARGGDTRRRGVVGGTGERLL